jgi:hypothetical protein
MAMPVSATRIAPEHSAIPSSLLNVCFVPFVINASFFPTAYFAHWWIFDDKGSGHPDRFLCVLAEVWQPQWLRNLCTDPTYFLFPGQFAPMQQKTFGAILVLVGIIDLEAARAFSIETLADRPLQIVVPSLSGALADPVRTCGPLYFCS